MFKLMNEIPKDKLLHFFWGFILAAILWTIWIFVAPSMIVLVLLHGLFAWLKEIVHDWLFKRGNFEIMDAVMTQIPMLALWGVLFQAGAL